MNTTSELECSRTDTQEVMATSQVAPEPRKEEYPHLVLVESTGSVLHPGKDGKYPEVFGG